MHRHLASLVLPLVAVGIACGSQELDLGADGPDASATRAPPLETEAGVTGGLDAASDGSVLDAGDLGGPRYLVPTWVKTASSVAFGTPVAVAADGTVVAGMTMKDALSLGEGEPGAASFTGAFEPVVAWFEGESGRVLSALQVAAVPNGGAGTGTVTSLGIDESGTTFVAGEFANAQTFFPGTASATPLVAETRLLGGVLVNALDPWAVRVGPAGEPRGLTYGRTPGPISKAWPNFVRGVAPVTGGGVNLVGRFEGAGLVLGSGLPSARTLGSAEGGSYVARLDGNGALTSLVEHAGVYLELAGGLTGGETHSVGLAEGSVTLYAGTASALTLPSWPAPGNSGPRRYVVTKSTPAGAAAWVRTLELPFYGTVRTGAVRGDGSVVYVGSCQGGVKIRDAAGGLLREETFAVPQECALSFGADGTVEWIRSLGDAVFAPKPALLGQYAVVTTPTGEALILAAAASGASLPIASGIATLPFTKNSPTPAADPELTVVLRLSRTGAFSRVDVLGENFFPHSATLAPDGALVLGGTYENRGGVDAVVGGTSGARVVLPAAVAGKQRGLVMKVSP